MSTELKQDLKHAITPPSSIFTRGGIEQLREYFLGNTTPLSPSELKQYTDKIQDQKDIRGMVTQIKEFLQESKPGFLRQTLTSHGIHIDAGDYDYRKLKSHHADTAIPEEKIARVYQVFKACGFSEGEFFELYYNRSRVFPAVYKMIFPESKEGTGRELHNRIDVLFEDNLKDKELRRYLQHFGIILQPIDSISLYLSSVKSAKYKSLDEQESMLDSVQRSINSVVVELNQLITDKQPKGCELSQEQTTFLQNLVKVLQKDLVNCQRLLDLYKNQDISQVVQGLITLTIINPNTLHVALLTNLIATYFDKLDPALQKKINESFTPFIRTTIQDAAKNFVNTAQDVKPLRLGLMATFFEQLSPSMQGIIVNDTRPFTRVTSELARALLANTKVRETTSIKEKVNLLCASASLKDAKLVDEVLTEMIKEEENPLTMFKSLVATQFELDNYLDSKKLMALLNTTGPVHELVEKKLLFDNKYYDRFEDQPESLFPLLSKEAKQYIADKRPDISEWWFKRIAKKSSILDQILNRDPVMVNAQSLKQLYGYLQPNENWQASLTKLVGERVVSALVRAFNSLQSSTAKAIVSFVGEGKAIPPVSPISEQLTQEGVSSTAASEIPKEVVVDQQTAATPTEEPVPVDKSESSRKLIPPGTV